MKTRDPSRQRRRGLNWPSSCDWKEHFEVWAFIQKGRHALLGFPRDGAKTKLYRFEQMTTSSLPQNF